MHVSLSFHVYTDKLCHGLLWVRTWFFWCFLKIWFLITNYILFTRLCYLDKSETLRSDKNWWIEKILFIDLWWFCGQKIQVLHRKGPPFWRPPAPNTFNQFSTYNFNISQQKLVIYLGLGNAKTLSGPSVVARQDRELGKIFVDKIYTPQATQIQSYINFIN